MDFQLSFKEPHTVDEVNVYSSDRRKVSRGTASAEKSGILSGNC